MQEQKRVHSGEIQSAEMGRELTEEELEAVCGGAGIGNTVGGNPGSLGQNFGGLGNPLGGVLGGNQTNGAGGSLPLLGSIPGLESLQNVLGGLGGLGGGGL